MYHGSSLPNYFPKQCVDLTKCEQILYTIFILFLINATNWFLINATNWVACNWVHTSPTKTTHIIFWKLKRRFPTQSVLDLYLTVIMQLKEYCRSDAYFGPLRFIIHYCNKQDSKLTPIKYPTILFLFFQYSCERCKNAILTL